MRSTVTCRTVCSKLSLFEQRCGAAFWELLTQGQLVPTWKKDKKHVGIWRGFIVHGVCVIVLTSNHLSPLLAVLSRSVSSHTIPV